ncbi:MAG: helix-turn-helix domain-containing protein [Rhodospirillaceae bacterium]
MSEQFDPSSQEAQGRRLKQLRLAAGFRRAAHFAEAHGFSTTWYTAIESDGPSGRPIPPAKALDLAKIFKVSPEYLLRGEEGNTAGWSVPVLGVLQRGSFGPLTEPEDLATLDQVTTLAIQGVDKNKLSAWKLLDEGCNRAIVANSHILAVPVESHPIPNYAFVIATRQDPATGLFERALWRHVDQDGDLWIRPDSTNPSFRGLALKDHPGITITHLAVSAIAPPILPI